VNAWLPVAAGRRALCALAALGLVGLLGNELRADVTLTGIAILPAQTFAPETPSSGGYADDGRKLATPRFEAQPIQGISAIAPVASKTLKGASTKKSSANTLPKGNTPTEWWALSDNGFGTRANSGDYRLAIYRLKTEPVRAPAKPERRARPKPKKTAPTVTVVQRIALRDPDRHFPWLLTLSTDPDRPLTGADADPESLVVMDDGSFWIGDEHGPWLLHFGVDGRLLAAPVELVPGGSVLRSAAHPEVVNGGKVARLGASKGFEGLARGLRPNTLIAMLEAPIPGDLSASVRLLEYDLALRAWTGREWLYPLDSADHAVSEIVRDPFSGPDGYLVIERDALQGPAAAFKKIFRIRLARLPEKTLAADLLNIADPQKIAGGTDKFRFPFLTTEALWPTAARELVVVNDNNFPAAGGRSSVVPDQTEWIFLWE